MKISNLETILKTYVKAVLAVLVSGIVATACSDEITGGGGQESHVAVTVELTLPELGAEYEVVDQAYTFTNISTGRSQTFNIDSDIDVLPGLYDVAYTARAINRSGGADSRLSARSQSVIISSTSTRVQLTAYNNIEADDLIIAEVFFTGTLQPSGNIYNGDDYVKLYNNTDHVIYADGLTLFESKFTTSQKYDYTPDIMAEAMTVQALYTIPGSGTDVPVAPGEYLLLCDTGIDHRVANPNSFDLSGADFEWYDVSSSPSSIDIDGPVANLDKWYCYTKSFWLLHNRGLKAYGIARIPVGREAYLRDYHYSYDYIQVTTAGDFPMSASAYRLPNEWISDVVMCSVDALYQWQVCSPALDSGWTGCGSIDHDKTRFFHSVRRKLLYVTDDGRAVLQDTNNSTNDFNRMCTPSEIERQGTATDVNGTPATTTTYDGITECPAK